MSTQTSRLSLVKPAYSDTADIAVINANMDKIDAIALHIYPVGSIYMSVNSTSPATLFGGTWQQLQNRFLIGASSTYAVNATGGATSVSYTPAGSNSGGAVQNTTLTVNQIPSHNHTFTGSGNAAEAVNVHTHTASVSTHDDTHGHTVSPHSHTFTYNKYPNNDNKKVAAGNDYKVRDQAEQTDSTSFTGTTTSSYTGSHSHTVTLTPYNYVHTHDIGVTGTIGNKGGGQAHGHGFTNPSFSGTAATIATMPPYLAVYMWKRTA